MSVPRAVALIHVPTENGIERVVITGRADNGSEDRPSPAADSLLERLIEAGGMSLGVEVFMHGSEEFDLLNGTIRPLSVSDEMALRRTVRAVMSENVTIYENLSATQDRCGRLLLKARDWRKRIVELGGEDPGEP